jgi:hypothetical protein
MRCTGLSDAILKFSQNCRGCPKKVIPANPLSGCSRLSRNKRRRHSRTGGNPVFQNFCLLSGCCRLSRNKKRRHSRASGNLVFQNFCLLSGCCRLSRNKRTRHSRASGNPVFQNFCLPLM